VTRIRLVWLTGVVAVVAVVAVVSFLWSSHGGDPDARSDAHPAVVGHLLAEDGGPAHGVVLTVSRMDAAQDDQGRLELIPFRMGTVTTDQSGRFIVTSSWTQGKQANYEITGNVGEFPVIFDFTTPTVENGRWHPTTVVYQAGKGVVKGTGS
jgi:hypothetical protein